MFWLILIAFIILCLYRRDRNRKAQFDLAVARANPDIAKHYPPAQEAKAIRGWDQGIGAWDKWTTLAFVAVILIIVVPLIITFPWGVPLEVWIEVISEIIADPSILNEVE